MFVDVVRLAGVGAGGSLDVVLLAKDVVEMSDSSGSLLV